MGDEWAWPKQLCEPLRLIEGGVPQSVAPKWESGMKTETESEGETETQTELTVPHVPAIAKLCPTGQGKSEKAKVDFLPSAV
ncbi:hypothetical protein ACLKA7_001128 [Drosophila subpalustris]